MENEKIIRDPQTEEFDFGKHALNALYGALYYLIVYIPFILPYNIWGKAATRISHIWENKSLVYKEGEKVYPVHSFYFMYLVNFLIDALIFLIWIFGFLFFSYVYFIKLKAKGPIVETYLIPLFSVYTSVIWLKAGKEILHFFLNNMVVWFLDVIAAIGRFLKHMWGLNFVFRKKD